MFLHAFHNYLAAIVGWIAPEFSICTKYLSIAFSNKLVSGNLVEMLLIQKNLKMKQYLTMRMGNCLKTASLFLQELR